VQFVRGTAVACHFSSWLWLRRRLVGGCVRSLGRRLRRDQRVLGASFSAAPSQCRDSTASQVSTAGSKARDFQSVISRRGVRTSLSVSDQLISTSPTAVPRLLAAAAAVDFCSNLVCAIQQCGRTAVDQLPHTLVHVLDSLRTGSHPNTLRAKGW